MHTYPRHFRHVFFLCLFPSLKSLKGNLEARGWLSLQWTDPRLSFSSEDTGNLTTLKVDPKDIWVPDVEIYNL